MSRDGVAKVFNLECTLQSRSEEATEGGYQRSKRPEHDNMELNWHDVETAWDWETLREERESVVLGNEDSVRSALKARPDVRAKVVDRADEVLVLRQEVGDGDTPDNGEKPCAQETLPRLLRRDLNQRCSSKGNTAEVCEDVVGDDHGNGQNEPDEALKDVVDDEVCLSDDEEEGHVGPSELGELELVVALLQGEDEEDEA
jgi:hypothetical protein